MAKQIGVGGARKHLAALARVWKAAATAARRHDGIDEDATFYVLSDDNPYGPLLRSAAQEFFDAVSACEAGLEREGRRR